MTRTLPRVHELVVMRIEGRQLVERVVLHGDCVIRICAGRTVVPRKEDGGPPIVEAEAEHELIVKGPRHQSFHLRLPHLVLLNRTKPNNT